MIKDIADHLKNVNKTKKKNVMDEKKENNSTQASTKSYTEDELTKMIFSSSLSKNNELVKQIVGSNTDLVIRDFTLGMSEAKSATLYYIDSMIDSHHVDNDVMRPLVTDVYVTGLKTGAEIIKQLNAGNVITRAQRKSGKNMNDLLKGLLSGEVGLFIDDLEGALIISTKGYEYRSVPEVEVEPSVMGPMDAFNEVLSVNIGLIRRRVQSPNLNIETVTIGSETHTKVCIAHVKGICKTELLNEVRSRINRINIDGVIGSTQIKEFIIDNPYSLFPQIRITERPDVASAALLEGRVVIIADGTRDILIAPGELASLVQSAEDYNTFYIYGSFIRILRYIAILITIILPALYISVTSYHQEMLPENLIESIAASRIGVPFPAIFEALTMEFTFEILREAGVRLARPVGGAVSIVGALVIGQAAVQANIVSPLMVIIVSLTGIASFVIPQYIVSFPLRLSRFALMILSAILGFYGLILGLLFILFHLCSLRSFGVPYLAPLSPFDANGLKDTVVRFPFWAMIHRPMQIARNSKHLSFARMAKSPKNGRNNS